MADIALDLQHASLGTPQYHDLVLSDAGDLVLTQGTAAIQQAVVQALKQFTQDWFLNMTAGLPYREQLFGGRDLSPAFEAVLQNRVLQVPGVLGLLQWQTAVDRVARTLTLRMQAQTTSGTVNWNLNVDVG